MLLVSNLMFMENIFMDLMDNISHYLFIILMPLYLYHQILIYIYFYRYIMYVGLIFDLMNLRYILYLMMERIFNILQGNLILNSILLLYIFSYLGHILQSSYVLFTF